MRRRYCGYHYSHPVGSPVHPCKSGLGALPLILLCAFGIAAAANGLGLMMGVSFLPALIISLVFYGFKLYFLLRHQPRYEQTVDSRRDKVFGYVILAAILLVLSAYGLYSFGGINHAVTTIADQALHTSEGFIGFFEATISKDTHAIVCWIASAVAEIIIIIIALRDHREYDY